LLLALCSGCGRARIARAARPPAAARPLTETQRRIVEGARREVERGVRYDARYVTLPYPGGDVAPDRGACTDVVIRALRNAGYDLQALIHRDMRREFRLYPRRYGLSVPDRSIDHRRTPNQMTFLRRFGTPLRRGTTGRDAATWQPGDLVYCNLPGGLGHCGVISDRYGWSGLPLVIHNAGAAREEDCLGQWEITGHFRFPRPRTP
jgi:uncharacterized protein YijF (DUF1287 family)